MLPFMVILFAIFFIRMVKYSKRTNHMVHQVLLDPTGTELTIVFKNEWLRKMRQDSVERTMVISNLANPPQQGEYRELVGDLFPEEYPFDYSRIFDYRYFWIKYYMSQRNLLALAKKPTYVNHEVLNNAFATKIIDLSQAQIFQIKNTEMSKEELEDFLEEENQYSI